MKQRDFPWGWNAANGETMAERYGLELRDFALLTSAGALAARARRGRMLVADLMSLLCLVSLGFVDATMHPSAIAQEVVAQDPWHVMDPAVLTVEQEKAQAAKPGSDFKECANGCPVMIVIPAGKFMMGSPENEPDRNSSEGPPHEVTIAKPIAVSKFEVTFEEWMLASPRLRARESQTVGDAGRCLRST